MAIAIVTGSGGLIGSEAVKVFAEEGYEVVGIDNDMRRYFFGDDASTAWNSESLTRTVPVYSHQTIDIRDAEAVDAVFARYGRSIGVVVHTAAQPSHDWAVREPMTDFSVNATGTLVMLEAARRHCSDAAFLYTSTNKVYGDTPNRLPLVETETRWELAAEHPFAERGIDETMSIDASTHSLFGVSKTAGDLLVQEYGHYFGMKTVTFRGGCLTGPAHSGAELHGFLAYLMKCVATGKPYSVFGYEGKQVRDNIHSADFCSALLHAARAPKPGSVYNMGGGRDQSCSMLEAICLCENIAGRTLDWSYVENNRVGDHVWWISDTSKFAADYPDWSYAYTLQRTLEEVFAAVRERHAEV
jgi:CDP-paratose 2-epimerase